MLVGLATPALAVAQPAREKALDLFDESKVHYRAARYRRAAELLREAYALYPEPVLLYNLARSYEGLDEPRRALEHYRSYLDEEPGAANRAAVEQRIAGIERRLEKRAPARARDRARRP